MNTSMAGLSDYSMGDIQQLGGDDSIAEYANTSMADLTEDKEEEETGDTGSNMLDSLKEPPTRP
jgi:hypothetical protein